MGLPDKETGYENRTIWEGWQHCLTVPRELCFRNGRIYQRPVTELETLRREPTAVCGRGEGRWETVFSTRYYGEGLCPEILVQAAEFTGSLWRLDGMRYIREIADVKIRHSQNLQKNV